MCGTPNCQKPTQGNRWLCNDCMAEYMRTYRKVHRQRIERKAFNGGVEVMRQTAVQLFAGMPTIELNGRAVAAFLEKLEPGKFT